MAYSELCIQNNCYFLLLYNKSRIINNKQVRKYFYIQFKTIVFFDKMFTYFIYLFNTYLTQN